MNEVSCNGSYNSNFSFLLLFTLSKLCFSLDIPSSVKNNGGDFVQELRRVNAPKNRAKSETRGYSSKPNLPSFSVCNKVLMSLETPLRFKFQNAA